MKVSIQTKLLALSIFLVFLSTVTISTAYYILIRQDKHRESAQRIQIAFDIIRDDFSEQFQLYIGQFEEFLQREQSLALTTKVYARQPTEQMSLGQTLVSQLVRIGYITSADRLKLYSADQKLIVTYFPSGTQSRGEIEWPSQEQPVMLSDEIPQTIFPSLFADEDGQVGGRITAPLLENTEILGVLVGDFMLTEAMVKWYAALSKTEVNFFAGTQLSVGTLSAQSNLEPSVFISSTACDKLADMPVKIAPVSFAGHAYYQG